LQIDTIAEENCPEMPRAKGNL